MKLLEKKKRISALLYEYSQGPNAMCHTLVAGGFDPKKHASILDTAKQELSEEARLKGGEWIPLLPMDSQGVPELKWSRNQFMPFLVLDPEPDTNPLERDLEGIVTF